MDGPGIRTPRGKGLSLFRIRLDGPAPTETPLRWVQVKVKFTLEQATKAQSGSRDIAVLFP